MRAVSRWQGALAGTLLASAVGLFVADPVFLVLALPPLVYTLYGASTTPEAPSLSVERTMSDDHSDPGERVTVDVTVTNDGDRTAPDLRLVDEVPEGVPVVGGTPAACIALRPGESTTISYEVLPPRGTHEFGTVTLRARTLPGTAVETVRLDPDGATTLTCDTVLDIFPLWDKHTRLTGRHLTDTGGDGTAFHGIREYHRGDPTNRIDWRRLARTGEVTTVTYREERAARVLFLVDDRAAAAVSPPGGGPTTTDLTVYAAARGFMTLTDAGDPVGVTTLTADDTDDWVRPGRDDGTEAAMRTLLDGISVDETPTDDSNTVDSAAALATDGSGADAGAVRGLELVSRLSDHTQVVFCTPLVDDGPVAVVETLLSNHVPVSVLSPDPTPDDDATPGQAATALGRRARTSALHRLGVPVTDWSPDSTLDAALASTLAAHERRWQR